MRSQKLGESIARTISAHRDDGSVVLVEEVVILMDDPTLTGAVWKAPPIPYTVYRLRDGNEVALEGDKIAVIVDTGERLTWD